MPIYFKAGGDLSGTPVEQTVTKIKGVEISGAAAAGKKLTASSKTVCSWEDDDVDFTAGGDLTGTSTEQNVVKINGGTAPGNPVTGDIGKVITVISAGVYGLANVPVPPPPVIPPPVIPPTVTINISGLPGSGTVNWAAGNVFRGFLVAGVNFIGFANIIDGKTIVVRLTGAGSSSVIWSSPVKWGFGLAPTQTAAGVDVYTFVSDGTFVYGSVVQIMS